MNEQFPHRRELKFRAKRWMMHPSCVRVTLLLVCVMLAFFGIRYLLGANLTYALVSLENYQDTATGIYYNAEGFSIIFRMDLTQMVLAIPLTYDQLTAFLVAAVVTFLVLSPLRMGAMEQYWSVLRGGQPKINQVFRWYTQPGRLGKAWAVEFVLQVLVRLVGIIATIPSLYLYYTFYTTVTSLEQMSTGASLLQSAAALLAMAAAIFCFWLHSLFLPVRYCLAAHPEYSLKETFRRGLRSMKGYRSRFFWYRMTFAVWFFLSQLTYNALDLFVLPYTSMASMLYIQEVARFRQQQEA